MWVKLREDLHPMDLFGIHSVGSISTDKIYKVESIDDSNCYKILDDNGRFIRLHNSYFIVNPTINLCDIAEPSPQNIYHITYSLQYAEGVELGDISKANITQIEGEVISKGRTWVIETDKGTVIIPFKSIIHMHPQY